MQIQKTNNYSPVNKQAFGMKISAPANYSTQLAIENRVIGHKLGAKIVAALETLKNTPQPERYSLNNIKFATSDNISKILVHDRVTNNTKIIPLLFNLSIPRVLKKLTNTEHVEKMMEKLAVKVEKYEKNKNSLTTRLNNLSK